MPAAPLAVRKEENKVNRVDVRRLYRFIWSSSASRQTLCCAVALVTLPLTLLPIELQRRLIDDAMGAKNLKLLIILISVYGLVITLQQVVKYIYNVLTGKISEHVIRTLRVSIVDDLPTDYGDPDRKEGAVVSMLTGEVEPVGGFAGRAYGLLVTEGGVLLAIFAYMLYTQWALALVAFIAFIPQTLTTPFVQNWINTQSAKRIGLLRDVGDDAVDISQGDESGESPAIGKISSIYAVRLIINKLKYGLRALLNLFDHAADLAVLGFGGYLVIKDQSTVGVVVAFLSGLSQIRDPFRSLITYFRVLSDAALRFRMLNDEFPALNDNITIKRNV